MKFEGYIWDSYNKNPKVYYGNKEIKISTDEVKGYIIEGLLYCNNTSIIIRHSGKYHIHEYDLNKLDEENLVKVEYLPHRLKKVKKVCFKQIWITEKDPCCEDMDVLKMKALVFTGFNNCK